MALKPCDCRHCKVEVESVQHRISENKDVAHVEQNSLLRKVHCQIFFICQESLQSLFPNNND